MSKIPRVFVIKLSSEKIVIYLLDTRWRLRNDFKELQEKTLRFAAKITSGDDKLLQIEFRI